MRLPCLARRLKFPESGLDHGLGLDVQASIWSSSIIADFWHSRRLAVSFLPFFNAVNTAFRMPDFRRALPIQSSH